MAPLTVFSSREPRPFPRRPSSRFRPVRPVDSMGRSLWTPPFTVRASSLPPDPSGTETVMLPFVVESRLAESGSSARNRAAIPPFTVEASTAPAASEISMAPLVVDVLMEPVKPPTVTAPLTVETRMWAPAGRVIR